MIQYFLRYYDRLLDATLVHLEIVFTSLFFSFLVAAGLVWLASQSEAFSKVLIGFLSMIYSIPSLAMFALFIPLTGLGNTTAILVLTIYNQYLLLRNIISGLNAVNPAIVEAAAGMGMTPSQILLRIKIPLARKSIFAGFRIALVSTIGIATIAATINAGGLGVILFDGLRTMNVNKIVWGSILSAGLAILAYGLLGWVENSMTEKEISP